MFQLLIRADQYRDDDYDQKIAPRTDCSRPWDRLEEVGDASEWRLQPLRRQRREHLPAVKKKKIPIHFPSLGWRVTSMTRLPAPPPPPLQYIIFNHTSLGSTEGATETGWSPDGCNLTLMYSGEKKWKSSFTFPLFRRKGSGVWKGVINEPTNSSGFI